MTGSSSPSLSRSLLARTWTGWSAPLYEWAKVKSLIGLKAYGGSRRSHREVPVDGELVPDLPFAVREDEPGVLLPSAQLRCDREHVVDGVGVVGLLAVRDVQVRPHARVVALHGRLLVGAGPGHVDGVVGGWGVDLEPEGVEEELTEREVGDVELRLGHLEDLDQRLRLGFGAGRWSPIGLVGDVRVRALLVVVPVLADVPVVVHPVQDAHLVVGVVVPEVLPPEPVVVERVL